MTRKIRNRVGSGVTQRTEEKVVFDSAMTPGDAALLFKLLSAGAQRNVPWAWLDRERGTAERTLAAIEAGETGGDGDRIFERWHGAGWFSKEILDRIDRIERARERGQIEDACRASAELSELTTAIRIKNGFDPDVETGIKVRDSLAERRNAANERKREAAALIHRQWQQEADKIWRVRPSLSASSVASIIKAKLESPASIRTIRGAIRKLAAPG